MDQDAYLAIVRGYADALLDADAAIDLDARAGVGRGTGIAIRAHGMAVRAKPRPNTARQLTIPDKPGPNRERDAGRLVTACAGTR